MIAATLTEHARAGDQHAFVSMLEPVLPDAHRLAFAMLQSPHDAEDAVQEAALNAWRHIGRFRDGTDIRPWFLTIVANQCRTQRRSRWRSVLKQGDPPAVDATAFALAELSARASDLRRALLRLPHDQRLVLVLRYYLDLPFDEIGPMLGISAKAAKSRTHRALERLRLLPEVTLDG